MPYQFHIPLSLVSLSTASISSQKHSPCYLLTSLQFGLKNSAANTKSIHPHICYTQQPILLNQICQTSLQVTLLSYSYPGSHALQIKTPMKHSCMQELFCLPNLYTVAVSYLWSNKYVSLYFCLRHSGVPKNFVRGGVSTNSVEDRENGDLGAVAPQSGVLEAAEIWYKKFHYIQ